MRYCKLKNGSTLPQPVVIFSMKLIKDLANSLEPNEKHALYHLGKKAYDSKYQIENPECIKVLKDHAILQHDESLYGYVKDVARSAISFVGEIVVIGDPVEESFNE